MKMWGATVGCGPFQGDLVVQNRSFLYNRGKERRGGPLTLGEKICTLRTGKGLSQEDLAAKLEVSRQSVSKWETGVSHS